MSEPKDATYDIHSMMVAAVVDLQPTKLEMLDSIEESVSGHIYSPPGENTRVVITGRNWDEKKFLVYGCTSLEEAEKYIRDIAEKVESVGHTVRSISGIEAVNIAVNGDFHKSIRLEALVESLTEHGLDAEYEPEQFPGVIVHLSDPSVTFLVFASGKFIIQGVNSTSQIKPAISKMDKLIK